MSQNTCGWSYGGVAPTLIYFKPKNIWVLMYEWGPWAFTYLTSTNPTSASSWQGPNKLYDGSSIDETVLCTSTTCYLFFANDDGTIHRASMPIADFPGAFTNATTILNDNSEPQPDLALRVLPEYGGQT